MFSSLRPLALAAALLPSLAFAQFSLPPLPYAADALEPVIDKTTMEIHHDRHHAAYVNNLNAQIKSYPELEHLSLDALQGKISQYNAAVRNNGGGHYNHDLFWKVMAEPGLGGEPSAALKQAIDAQFGNLDELKKRFDQAAVSRFGSGWAWLVRNADGSLAIEQTSNAATPLRDGKTCLLTCDVWEHAYYLKYQNRRPEYIEAFYRVIDWAEVERRFVAAGG